MARGKVDEVDRTTDFYEYMFTMRRNLSFIDALVKLLEDIPDNANLSQVFCISYVIKFLRTYCDTDDDYELALASYGFLEGFSYKKYKSVQERTKEYWKYACKYEEHEFIRSNWTVGTALTELKDAHIIIIGYLDKISQKVKDENGGKLGLIEEVPKELVFPKPRMVKERPTEQLYEADAPTSPTVTGDMSTNEEIPLDTNVESDKLDSVSGAESNHTGVMDGTIPEKQMVNSFTETDSILDDEAYKPGDMISEENSPKINPPNPPPPEPDSKSRQIKILMTVTILLLIAVIVLVWALMRKNDTVYNSGNRQPANESSCQYPDTYLSKETITEKINADGSTETITEKEYSLILPNPPIDDEEEKAADSFIDNVINFFEWLNNLFREDE